MISRSTLHGVDTLVIGITGEEIGQMLSGELSCVELDSIPNGRELLFGRAGGPVQVALFFGRDDAEIAAIVRHNAVNEGQVHYAPGVEIPGADRRRP